ncbi:MAG: hypothetical protein EOO50_08690 [Flavobacterium sp.]|uniref:hypothetical protein n=1 Tax=Flavobacterium sp. TaxID=239 RepID=UPI0011F68669|nr:hypothetical protein [Flavobacterium sp.]RZJ66760.1 MAG: hypothetical protein EOO50_08690 [Flavobacterium sp.]
MIDGIRMKIADIEKFENDIMLDGVLPMAGGKTDFFTGNVLEYPKGGNLNSLEYKITEQGAIISGSVHKFYNNVILGEDQNYDDFGYSKLVSATKLLNRFFHLEGGTTLTNLEFGFNIKIDEDPNDFVKYRVLMYNFRDHEERDRFDTGEYYKEFRRTDYKWKIYKKTNFKKPNENILRIEIKFLRSRQLDKLGIVSINDLTKKENLENLFDFFLDKFEDLMIVDSGIGNVGSIEQRNRLMQFTNIKYWNDLIEQNVTDKVRDNRRASAIKLISNLKMDTTKNILRDKIVSKFSLLIAS